MNVAETVIIALIAMGAPFGPVPFTVAPYTEDTAKVEVMTEPPRVFIVDENMLVLEVDGEEITHEQCKQESEI